MKSGAIVLLLGLLALWAQLPPAAGEICSLPTEVGPCTAAIPRWVYNWHSKKCEEFSSGGCNGNKNNFETKVDCLQACAGQAGLPNSRLPGPGLLRGRAASAALGSIAKDRTSRKTKPRPPGTLPHPRCSCQENRSWLPGISSLPQ
ncbi:unnamed protein product [Natator depressus]